MPALLRAAPRQLVAHSAHMMFRASPRLVSFRAGRLSRTLRPGCTGTPRPFSHRTPLLAPQESSPKKNEQDKNPGAKAGQGANFDHAKRDAAADAPRSDADSQSPLDTPFRPARLTKEEAELLLKKSSAWVPSAQRENLQRYITFWQEHEAPLDIKVISRKIKDGDLTVPDSIILNHLVQLYVRVPFTVFMSQDDAATRPVNPPNDTRPNAPSFIEEMLARATKATQANQSTTRSDHIDGWVLLNEAETEVLARILPETNLGRATYFQNLIRSASYVGVPPSVKKIVESRMSDPQSVTTPEEWKAAFEDVMRFQGEPGQIITDKNKGLFSPNSPPGSQNFSGQGGNRQQGSGAGGNGDQDNKNQGKGPLPDPPDWRPTVIFLSIFLLWMLLSDSPGGKEITWQEFRTKYLEKGLVKRLIVMGDTVRVDLDPDAARAVYGEMLTPRVYFSIGSRDSFERKIEEAQRELGIPTSEQIPISYERPSMIGNIIMSFAPTLLMVGLLVWMMRRGTGGGGVGGNPFRFGKSQAKLFNHESAVKVKFADVAGADEAKQEIVEFVSFLKTPDKFVRLGAKIPRGAILSGPPGTGKTLLAKATAGESGVPFFSVSGSEFVEMFVGVGASRVRDLFKEARKHAPCIIFIDEIDAIGKSRDSNGRFGGNDEREATLNQILTEMDGFNTNEQVVVLAGTNRPDILDKALMRPGRFDRHIHIDRPTMKGRADIFRVHLGRIRTEEDMDYLCGRLSALTPGFAGADIANVVNEAALVAARDNAESVAMVHFERAIERVIGGLERKSLVLGPEEKRTVAYHEAGHAVCGWYFQWADPLLKVSIIPRGSGALGYAQYLPSGDAYLMNVNQLMDRMAMTLGGRVSEELHFPTVTTGASDDFKKVTQMATTMVTQWGMSDKLGPLHFNQDPNQIQRPFAESTAQTIDSEVRRIVDEAYKKCRDLLTEKKKEVGIIAEELLRKEQLTRDDIVRLLGPRQWPDKEEFAKYFDGTKGGGAPEPPPTGENLRDPPAPPSPPAPEPAVFKRLDGESR